MNLFRSTVVIGGLTGVSRVLGFARDALIASVLGAGPISDAFYAALRLPNLFRRLLAEGAFNSAFVPLYARRLEGDADGDGAPDDGDASPEARAARQAEADRFASETFSVLIIVLVVLVLAAEAAMPWLMRGLMPGRAGDADWITRATVLGLFTMPYILFMSLTAMFGGVLNAHGRFAAFAAAPTLLNVVLVALLLSPIGQEWRAATWLAAGVAVAGVLQCAVVYAGLVRQGVSLRLAWPRLTPGVKRVVALGIPGAVSAGVTQVNIVISQMIASFQAGAVSWMSYADRLYQFPLGMIGIAMGVALLPMLSRRLRANDEQGARDSLNRAIEISALFTVPAAAALATGAAFWVAAMFEHGRFSPDDTAMTAAVLVAFAVGLPAFIGVKIFAPGFFAREDTKTPMRYAAVAVVVNIALGAALFMVIGVVGLAVATSVAGWINAILLARTLARDGLLAPDMRLKARLPRVALAAAATGGFVWWASRAMNVELGQSIVWDLTVAAGVAAAGGLLYLIAVFVLGALRPSDLKLMTRRAA